MLKGGEKMQLNFSCKKNEKLLCKRHKKEEKNLTQRHGPHSQH